MRTATKPPTTSSPSSEKTAGPLGDLLARVVWGTHLAGGAASQQALSAREAALAEEWRRRQAAEEDESIRGAVAGHQRVPILLHDRPGEGEIPSGAVPLGMDGGMVRVASAIARDLSRGTKTAGIMANLAGRAQKALAPAMPKGSITATGATGARTTVAPGMSAGVRPNVFGPEHLNGDRSHLVSNQQGLLTPTATSPYRAPEAALLGTTAAPAAAGAAGAAATTAATGTGVWDRTKQLYQSGRLKGQLAGAAAIGGLAYGGYRAAKGALGWLAKEPAPQAWGEGHAQVPRGINAYGETGAIPG